MKENMKTQKMVILGMLCALAYVVVVVGRIPVVLFLNYEAKDVIIAIGGLIFGPMSAALISLVVSFIEMIIISSTGPIGMIMNVLASCSFACVAALIYKKKHNIKGAIAGLLIGAITMTVVMLLWNYLITPLYMNYPREAVVELLMPVFLPFNLLKGGLNAAITMLLYKPIVGALRRSRLLPDSGRSGASAGDGKFRISIGLVLTAGVLLVTCVMLMLVLSGKI